MQTDAIERIRKLIGTLEASYDHVRVRQRWIYESMNQGVQYVFNNGVEGDIAEFGTAWGFSAATIARAMSIYGAMFADRAAKFGNPPKRLQLFDSFEGLPEPRDPVDLRSPYVEAGVWEQGTYRGLNQQELAALCGSVYDPGKILVHAGWFSDTLPRVADGAKFAMLHLDCDLYSSSIEVLDHLFSRDMVADGAVIFFDDWNTNRSSRLLGQRRAWREISEKHDVQFSDCGDYAVLGHKFIVHAL
jgi:O-methyltransferase